MIGRFFLVFIPSAVVLALLGAYLLMAGTPIAKTIIIIVAAAALMAVMITRITLEDDDEEDDDEH